MDEPKRPITMLYGGPLGTYLSGLTSSGHSSTAIPPSSGYKSGAGSSGVIRRSSSRYRPGTGSTSSTASSSSSSYASGTGLSSYYTPQPRRKYDEVLFFLTLANKAINAL
ncbi:hypothetical protein Ciccas_004299 [Cichlidogyrus casuarinus]|uniref:Uncharacterized protein n=1 Tax=Cichlidogyrus casuarinus TaxID=1844966 RepID=A0ABD2QC07_9PLAT